MPDYIQVLIESVLPNQSEILIAELNDVGFEGFEEGDDYLKAFIMSSEFDEKIVKQIIDRIGVPYSTNLIKETNWNQVWESNFEPVIIDGFVGIRAEFHKPITNVMHEIVITPKMSFGTGHHATTCLMIEQMRDIHFNGRSVLDFGTGTGILAILANKLGSTDIMAIDNDPWSIANARENILKNNADAIHLVEGDNVLTNRLFDIILANINKNVILDNFPGFIKQLHSDGVLLLSGLLTEDEAGIRAVSEKFGLKVIKQATRFNWLCLRLSY